MEAQERELQQLAEMVVAVAVRVVRQLRTEELDPKGLTEVHPEGATRHTAVAVVVETLPLAPMETQEQEMAAMELRILDLATAAAVAAAFIQWLALQLVQAALVVVVTAASVAHHHPQVLLAHRIVVAAVAAAELVAPEQEAPEATAEAESW